MSVACDWGNSTSVFMFCFFRGSLVVVITAENFACLFRGHVLLTFAVNHWIVVRFASVSLYCVSKENAFLFWEKGFEKFNLWVLVTGNRFIL